jgi:hypothetical protein
MIRSGLFGTFGLFTVFAAAALDAATAEPDLYSAAVAHPGRACTRWGGREQASW